MGSNRRNPRNSIRCFCDFNLFYNLYVKTCSARHISRVFRISVSKYPTMDSGTSD